MLFTLKSSLNYNNRAKIINMNPNFSPFINLIYHSYLLLINLFIKLFFQNSLN